MASWPISLNPLICFLPYNLRVYTHTHTHMRAHLIIHISGICRLTMNVLTFLSDYFVYCLPNNMNQLYANSTICMCRYVTRRHFSPNTLFHTSQVDWHSTLCMCWCLIRWFCWLNALLYTLHIYSHSPLCMHWCVFRLPCWLNALLQTSQV